MDELLKWSGLSKIDILKLDVEGAEKDIFESANCGKWLDCVRQIVVELHDRIVPGCSEALEHATEGRRFARSTSGECLVMRRIS